MIKEQQIEILEKAKILLISNKYTGICSALIASITKFDWDFIYCKTNIVSRIPSLTKKI